MVEFGGKVGLVGDKDLFLALVSFDLFLIIAGDFFADVEDVEDEFGLGDALMAAAYALGLDGVGGLAKASSVDEDDGDAADVGGFLDSVAGGTGGRGNDGAVGAEELVKETGLAGIGATDDGGADALAEDAALVGSGEQLVDGGDGGLEAGK